MAERGRLEDRYRNPPSINGVQHMKSRKQKSLAAIKCKQRGQGMTEYLIITALIAVAAIGVYRLFGDTIRNQVAGMAMEVSGQNGTDARIAAGQRANASTAAAVTQRNMSNFVNNNN